MLPGKKRTVVARRVRLRGHGRLRAVLPEAVRVGVGLGPARDRNELLWKRPRDTDTRAKLPEDRGKEGADDDTDGANRHEDGDATAVEKAHGRYERD